MRKRLTSFLLCFFLCISLLPVSAQATETAEVNTPEIPTEGDVWDGSTSQPTTLVQKDGLYYYEITKCSELAYVAQIGGDWLGYNYILGNNLIMNDVVLTWDEEGNCTNTEELNAWIPPRLFSGIIDGNGYSISGLYIFSDQNEVGLFQRIGDASICNLSITNAYVRGRNTVGGIAGRTQSTPDIRNCIFSGLVVGAECGGILGDAGSCEICNSTVYGMVMGSESAGGLCGNTNYTDISSCASTSKVFGGAYSTGGLVGGATNGRVKISNSYASGDVIGKGATGGFIGHGFNCTISQCFSSGNVTSTGGVAGGFIGEYADYSSSIRNCYSFGNVVSSTFGGGFVGSCADDIAFCYSMGTVVGETGKGGFIGEDRRIWGEEFSVKNCYYLKDDNYNENLFSTSIATADTKGGVEGKSINQLKVQSTFVNWDFDETWSISPDLNGGYPYLQWQENSLSDIAVNNVEISESDLALTVGDYAYLTATVSPANASNKSVTWKSSDSEIATVSAAGKVTAFSTGTAVITATTVDGGYTASCTVTVTERLSEEYRLNSIIVRDNDGAILSEIPSGTCLATVSITNLASEGNTLVFLAAYTSTGQYEGMMWVSVEDLPIGATIKVTLPVDNSDGKIENLKAFTIASFSNLTPLGEAVSFLP